MASLMPALLDFDDFSRFEFNPLSIPPFHTESSSRCGASLNATMQNPFIHQLHQTHELDLNANIPFDSPFENHPPVAAQDFSPLPHRLDSSPANVEQPITSVGFNYLSQHCTEQHYGSAPAVPHPPPTKLAPEIAMYGSSFSDAFSFPFPLPYTPAKAPSDLDGTSSLTLATTSSAETVSASSSGVSFSMGLPHKLRSSSTIGKDKLEERRRKNRESSSRCYYNRKRQIAEVERTLTEQKRRAITLYAQELELRNENARLKKELVMQNIRIPSSMLTTTRTETLSRQPVPYLGTL